MITPDFKGTHLSDRFKWAKENLNPTPSEFVIAFEDGFEGPVKVITPDPNWMACALQGGILSPIEAYLMDKKLPDGALVLAHIADPIGPMTEEEAIEYLIKKDIPNNVWDVSQGNSIKFVICRPGQLPPTTDFRSAWQLSQNTEIENVAA